MPACLSVCVVVFLICMVNVCTSVPVHMYLCTCVAICLRCSSVCPYACMHIVCMCACVFVCWFVCLRACYAQVSVSGCYCHVYIAQSSVWAGDFRQLLVRELRCHYPCVCLNASRAFSGASIWPQSNRWSCLFLIICMSLGWIFDCRAASVCVDILRSCSDLLTGPSACAGLLLLGISITSHSPAETMRHVATKCH